MNKKMMIIIFSVAIIAIGVFIAWGLSQDEGKIQPKSEDGEDAIIYYYGSSCSHCKKVADFISANEIESKLSIAKKEVTERANKQNAEEWIAKAKQCGFDEKEIGVPFMYKSGKCYMGDVDAIEFLRKEAGIN